MSRPRTKNKHLPKYVTVIHGSYWYRPPKAKPQRLAAVGEESEMYRKMADLVREVPQKAGNTFAVKDSLKAAGARWNPAGKCWGFESWDALDAALNSLVEG